VSISPDAGKPCELLSLKGLRYTGLELSGRRQPVLRSRYPKVDPKNSTLLLFPAWEHHGALDWLVELPTLPTGKKLVLRFGSLIQPHAGNNVQFQIEANGRTVFAEKLTGVKAGDHAPHQANLTPFAGQKVLLSLQARNCYLFNWLSLQRPQIAME
jgi:hypothetical protein